MTQPQNQAETQNQGHAQTEAQTDTETKPERSYRWGELPMQFHIHWLEPDEPGKPRQVMLSTTTYDDGPIARLVPDAPLENLVPQIQEMLAELEQSLPIRETRWQQQANKRKKTQSKARTQAKTAAATAPAQQANKPSPETQIKLF